jgi:putative membrane protein
MPSEGAHLHPVSVLVGVPLVQIVRALIVPAFAVLAGGRGDRTPLLVLVILLALLTLRVLAWQRFRWSFDGEVVRVEQGVLSRSRRVVDVGRVQQVELDRPFVQRLLGVATLRIETAGSDAGPEVELRVLGLEEALALREALQPRSTASAFEMDDGRAGTPTDGPAPLSEEVVLRLPLGRVALASVTGAQLLIAPALLTGLLQFAGDRTEELIDAAIAWLMELQSASPAPEGRTWLLGAAAVAVVAVTTTLVVSIVRDGAFVVLRVGDDLVLRRGLLGTRESTVPLRRVQVVRMTANPLRRALGVATLRIHSAGGSAGEGGDRRAVIPLVTDTELPGLLADLLPELDVLPELRPHPVAARRRALLRRLRGLASWALPTTAVWVLLAVAPDASRVSPVPLPDAILGLLAREDAAWSVPLLVGAVLLALQVVLARLEHAALGHGSDAHVVVARHGALTHTLSVAPLARLQGVTHRVSWFQARRDLATVRAHVAGPGGDVVVLDAAGTDAARLARALADAASGGRAGAGIA